MWDGETMIVYFLFHEEEYDGGSAQVEWALAHSLEELKNAYFDCLKSGESESYNSISVLNSDTLEYLRIDSDGIISQWNAEATELGIIKPRQPLTPAESLLFDTYVESMWNRAIKGLVLPTMGTPKKIEFRRYGSIPDEGIP